jgi:hypothetical protein
MCDCLRVAKSGLNKTLFLSIFFIFSFFSAYSRYTITKAEPINFCSAYPSAFLTRSFSLNESSGNPAQGFSTGQNNVTIIIGFSNSNFEFRPGFGSVTVTGTEVIINSFSVSTSSITVNLSTGGGNVELNSLKFNDMQIRALGTGTAIIRRTGGTMKVDNKTSNPSASESFGDISAGTPYFLNSASITQTITNLVYSGTTENEIIGIRLNISGNCGTINVNSLTFSTAGSTNPGNDISAAQVYYTAQTNSFSTSNLFGTFNNPNGIFTVTGNQELTLGAGTYYFWLTYDITEYGIAIDGNVVDAQLVSGTLNNITTNYSPALTVFGVRQIDNNIYHSIRNGNWTTIGNWSRTQGGPECGCAPVNGYGYAFVYHSINVNESHTLDYVYVRNGGNLTNAAGKTLSITQTLGTNGSGIFDISSAWNIRNVITSGFGISASRVALNLTGNLTVGSGTSLQMLNGSGLTVNGNININGTLDLGSSTLTGSNSNGTIFQGTGEITGTGSIILGVSKTAPSGTNLTIFPALTIQGNSNVFNNNGRINMRNSITGSHVTTQWTNGPNSYLQLGGTNASLMATGTLNASASGNTIEFSGSNAQTIKNPSSSIFHHLTIAGNGTKTLSAATTINGNITITGAAQFSVSASNYNITCNGNWINDGTNSTPFISGSGTVFFNNNSTIAGSGITHFRNINITSSGTLTSNSNANKVFVSAGWANEGFFNHNFSDITFNGSSTISGASTTDFYTVFVTSGSTLTLHSVETFIEGDLTANGAINHNNGLIGFSGQGNSQFINGLQSSVSFYRLQLCKIPAGDLILARPVNLIYQLSLDQGILKTDTVNILTMSSGSTSNAGSPSSYVNGPIAKIGNSAFVFPIGKNGRWARLAIGAPTTSTTVRAEYFDSPYERTSPMSAAPLPRLNNVSTKEHWSLDRISGTGSAPVTLYWENSEWSGITNCTNSDLRIGRWNGSGWESTGNVNTSGGCSGAASGSVTTSSTVSNFSPFTFASLSNAENALPIEMLFFEAKAVDQKINLSWSTATEFNNDFFTIEKSKDGKAFEKVVSVKGAGNSITILNYTAEDLNPYPGVSYYRLKQTDYDGAYTYSNVVAVKIEAPIANGFELYPNPLLKDQNLTLNFLGNQNENVDLKIIDQMGRVCFSTSLSIEKNNSKHTLNTPLSPGLYYVTGTVNNIPVIKKLVVKQ